MRQAVQRRSFFLQVARAQRRERQAGLRQLLRCGAQAAGLVQVEAVLHSLQRGANLVVLDPRG